MSVFNGWLYGLFAFFFVGFFVWHLSPLIITVGCLPLAYFWERRSRIRGH